MHRFNVTIHDGRCGAVGGTSICIINCDQASARLRLPLCRNTGSRVRKPCGGVGGRANRGCKAACGALASDVAEVGDGLSEYRGSYERGCPLSACCVYASLDELSDPVDVENWRSIREVSDDADGP